MGTNMTLRKPSLVKKKGGWREEMRKKDRRRRETKRTGLSLVIAIILIAVFRIRNLVDLSYKLDPRIRKVKDQEQKEKEEARQKRLDIIRKKQEEEVNILPLCLRRNFSSVQQLKLF